VTPEQVEEKGWPALFAGCTGDASRLIVEIGYCRGEFMMAQAEGSPEDAFVGIECSNKRTIKMARRLAKSGHRNIRIMNAYAEAVFPTLFAPESIDALWINFPDPWPKDRHARRRLVQPPFVALMAERLVDGGELHFATDDVPYAEQARDVFAAEPRLENLNAPEAWLPEVPGRMRTAYEEQWREEGRPLHFFAYRRRPSGPSQA